MNGLIDIRTASLFNAVVGLIFCLYMVHVFRTRKTYPGFREWTMASLFTFVAMVLIYFRDAIPAWASIVLSNVLAIAGTALLARGLGAFTGRPVNRWWLPLSAAAAGGLSILFAYVLPDLRARICTVSVLTVLLTGHCIVIARTRVAGLPRLPGGWLVCSLAILAGWNVLRIVLTQLFEGDTQDFMTASTIQGVSLVFLSASNIAIFLGLLVLHSHRTEAELQQALAEVKTLQGIIPICSSCKKIRDDRGAWNQLEAYISRHSEAEFTHGYCPDCAKHLLDTLEPFESTKPNQPPAGGGTRPG